MKNQHSTTMRHIIIGIWLVMMFTCLYIYFFHRNFIQAQLTSAVSASVVLGYFIYLILCSLRGFTLIPSTYTILLGLLFFPPVPLYCITMLGIMISSTCVYFFSESLNLQHIFEKKHSKQIAQLTSFLQKYELPVIIGWSFFLILPTDLLCYICGTLKINYKKFLLGITIGEGTLVAAYIFFGSRFLQFLHF